MNWKDSIKEIKKAQENNQLVIFVGAGVSRNSGLPGWWKLIEVIADKIGYSRCGSCKNKKDSCSEAGCVDRYAYTQDELLRIPEYFYQKDISEGHSAYYGLIQDTLRCDQGANAIDDAIFDIMPHHIITTNYDSLLEDSAAVNGQFYTVVTQDQDLLSKASERYIIKMHGDLGEPATIVLKESDYIDYEQKHPLISTFIRSLLVNHTFLFLGYSLNDYNLNLIIGWINYFSRFYGVEERPLNFLVSAEAPLELEQMRLEAKNIFVVDLASLPDDLPENAEAPQALTNIHGRRLFSYLRCITDSQVFQHYIPLDEILKEKYRILKSYQKISHDDLLKVQSLGYTAFMGTELVFYERKWYEQVAVLLDNGDQEIADIFSRAGLTAIHLAEDDTRKEIFPSDQEEDEDFELYLDNDYTCLWNKVESGSDISKKIYYGRLLGKSAEETEKLVALEAFQLPQGDYIALLLHKMRARLGLLNLLDRRENLTRELRRLFVAAPARYRDAIKYLEMLFHSSAENCVEMEKYVEKQEKRYQFKSNTWYSEHCFANIWYLQAYAYDYYFFFKKNNLPLDYFTNPQTYLNYYLKAVLCSYSPLAPPEPGLGFREEEDRFPYSLGEIELDMLVKYMPSKTLSALLNKYSVQSLEIREGIDVPLKYRNLCESIARFRHRNWYDQLFNFTVLICLLKLDDAEKKEIIHAFASMFQMVTAEYPGVAPDLFASLAELAEHMALNETAAGKGKLLDCLLLKPVYLEIAKRSRNKFLKVVRALSPYAGLEAIENLTREIDAVSDTKEKIQRILLFRSILPMGSYKEFLLEHREQLDSDEVFYLIIEKILPYNEDMFISLLHTIESEDMKRKKAPGMRTYPDWLMASIEKCMVLKLFGFDVDLEQLRPYAHYSKHLTFMMNPEDFDYSQVDTGNYMWQNLIYSNEYKKYFVAHKDKLLSADLKTLFDRGVETRDQQKIVYGLLLDENELRSFGG